MKRPLWGRISREGLRPFLLFATLLASCGVQKSIPPSAAQAKHAPAAACAGCHAAIATSYRATGMARSFTAFDASKTNADFTRGNRFHHKASDRHYTMTLRDDQAFMKRHQLDATGREVNAVERRIDYIMGSGYKAQTMIHRTPRGELVEMPVAWYTANGGHWAMNPSYDKPDHADFRRRIRYDCFFCHNAYPSVADDSFLADPVYPAQLPSGIDCQRCHGPGAAHVEAASANAPAEKVRAAIVNPKRLNREVQLGICYQCHLQSTSSPLPHVVIKLGRGVFSHRAGEPLRDYAMFFDHPAGSGFDDKFEIAHAAYRLRQSACFRSSQMTCTTCHDPHKPQPASSASCRACHAQPKGAAHVNVKECVSCHMPQRRTDDAVRVTMTDHKIVKRPPPAGILLAMKAERHVGQYRGRVEPMHPSDTGALYHAIAQVRVGANLTEGAAALDRAIAADPTCGADCYYELADAFGKQGQFDSAAKAAEQALRRAPESPWILRAYGSLLSARGDLARGAELLERALTKLGEDPGTLHALALNRSRQGHTAEAIELLRRAAKMDPDSAEVWFALGELLFASRDTGGAGSAFREALRAKPDYALAHFNLAAMNTDGAGAEEHFRTAARLAPGDPRIAHTYGVWLASRHRAKEAEGMLAAAVRSAPERLESHLALGMVLAELGDRTRANEHLRRAATSLVPEVRQQATEVLGVLAR